MAEIGNFPRPVLNLAQPKWPGFIGKLNFTFPFLQTVKPDDIVVVMDGGDVLWGGCDMQAFKDAYKHIAESSGASIVVAAEMTCWENQCDKVPPMPEWARNDKLISNGLQGDHWKEYAKCKGHWHPKNTTYGHCSSPPELKFLNSGFFMGPAKDLIPMVEWSLQNYARSTFGDQSLLADYWMEHPRTVTLDYNQQLVACMSDMDNAKAYEVKSWSGKPTLWNNQFNRPQCFVHGNGDGWRDGSFKNIVQKLSPTLDWKKLFLKSQSLIARSREEWRQEMEARDLSDF